MADAFGFGDDLPSVPAKQFPSLGERDPLSGPVQQRNAELVLQRGDVLAHRGLRQHDGLGAPRKASRFDDREKELELVEPYILHFSRTQLGEG